MAIANDAHLVDRFLIEPDWQALAINQFKVVKIRFPEGLVGYYEHKLFVIVLLFFRNLYFVLKIHQALLPQFSCIQVYR